MKSERGRGRGREEGEGGGGVREVGGGEGGGIRGKGLVMRGEV